MYRLSSCFSLLLVFFGGIIPRFRGLDYSEGVHIKPTPTHVRHISVRMVVCVALCPNALRVAVFVPDQPYK